MEPETLEVIPRLILPVSVPPRAELVDRLARLEHSLIQVELVGRVELLPMEWVTLKWMVPMLLPLTVLLHTVAVQRLVEVAGAEGSLVAEVQGILWVQVQQQHKDTQEQTG